MQTKLPDIETLRILYHEQLLSFGDIAKRYEVSRASVYQMFRRHDIPIRSKSEARLLALKRGKIKGHQHHQFNRAFFDEWSAPMAYILGLVYADGYVRFDRLVFCFGTNGLADVWRIIQLMESNARPKEVANNGFVSWRVTFCSNYLVERLHLLGTPIGKKSYNIRFPVDIPAALQRHFIRGYWDGDGTATNSQIKFSSVSCEFLQSVSDCLTLLDHNLGAGNIYSQKRAPRSVPQGGFTRNPVVSHTLVYCSQSARQAIYDLFYDEVPENQYSARKRERFEYNL